jgi:hypothetical protein
VVGATGELLQTTQCINLNRIAGRRVLADGSLLFEAVGGVDYRNRLASQCPGAVRISRSAVISVVASSPGSQLCRGDRVRVLDPVETSETGASSAPSCVLADFDIVPAIDLGVGS